MYLLEPMEGYYKWINQAHIFAHNFLKLVMYGRVFTLPCVWTCLYIVIITNALVHGESVCPKTGTDFIFKKREIKK